MFVGGEIHPPLLSTPCGRLFTISCCFHSPGVVSCLLVRDPDNCFFVFLSHLFLQFLLSRKEEEAVLVGGEWSPSLDGLDPKGDPQVLVRTAIRCAQAQTGIDLSACTKW